MRGCHRDLHGGQWRNCPEEVLPLWGLRAEAAGYVEALEQSTECEAPDYRQGPGDCQQPRHKIMEERTVSNALKKVAVDRKSMVVQADQLEKEPYLEWPKDYAVRSLVIAPIISPTGDLLGTVLLAADDRELGNLNSR